MNVLMLHSVGNCSASWPERYLSVTVAHFVSVCALLADARYRVLDLPAWLESRGASDDERSRSFVLTFDDGYLDNWVFAFPILKKYGLKATIFVSPEFVDPRSIVRPTLGDVWEHRLRQDELITLGYLSWDELKVMQGSGVFDVQSHSMSHNYVFRSGNVLDFYCGQPGYGWLVRLERPEKKAFSLSEDQSDLVPTGFPVLESDRALGCRAYLVDRELVDFLSSALEKRNGRSDPDGFREAGFRAVKDWGARRGALGRFESDEEMGKRYRYEIAESKRIIEEKLQKRVEYLCSPGGAHTQLGLRLAEEAGYKATTLGSRYRGEGMVMNSKGPRISRRGLGSFVEVKGERYLVPDPQFLAKRVESLDGGFLSRAIFRLRISGYRLAARFGGLPRF